MHYVLHDSVDLDLKTTPIDVPQTTRMVNTQRGRKINLNHHIDVIF